MRVRGLKLLRIQLVLVNLPIAPHAGARIETYAGALGSLAGDIAPHAGARIETSPTDVSNLANKSHPMRVRGLKLVVGIAVLLDLVIAPHAGARIETPPETASRIPCHHRTPCGCAD